MDADALMAVILRQQEQIAELTVAVREQSAAITVAATKPELGSDLTVAEIWTAYAGTIAGKSWLKSVACHTKQLRAHFAARPVLSLRRSDWENYRDNIRMKQEKKTHFAGPRSPNSLNGELRRMCAVFNWAVADLRIARNPWKGIKSLKARVRETLMTEDDIAAVLKCCCDVLRALILIAADSGMRATEVRMLRWSEIDFARGCVNLSPDRTKGKRARRPRLTDRALDAIRLLPRHVTSPFVFPNPETAVPYSTAWVWKRWRRAAAEAGLEAAPGDGRVHWHDWRHHAVSKMHGLGIPLFVGMRNAGHESAGQAWRYTHVSDDDLDDLKETLDRAILEGRRRGPKRARHDLDEGKGEVPKVLATPDRFR